MNLVCCPHFRKSLRTSSIGSLKTSIELEIRLLHTKVDELTKRVQQLEVERSNSLSSNSAQSVSASGSHQDTSTLQMTTVKSLLSEEKEKERRKLNLIFHKILESTSEDPLERKAHDIEQINFVLEHYVKVDTQVISAVRLGKKDSEKTRLLKVDVPSEKIKKLVLRNSIKLRDESNPDHIKKIFITPYLTPKEQEENKLLREKLYELNKAGKFYHIKTVIS